MSEASSSAKKNLFTCPICSAQSEVLLPIESGLRLLMQKENYHSHVTESCQNCIEQIAPSLAHNTKNREREEQRMSVLNEAWKNRIALIRIGKNAIDKNDLANAAIAYEKYLKIIELVYGKPFLLVSPQEFKDKSKEISVISACLWDLLKVYDVHPNYHQRQEDYAKKLSEFLRFSPLYPVIIRKAEIEVTKARNPNAYKYFLANSEMMRARCFVATVAFRNPEHPTVLTLRQFRDQILKKHRLGRSFVALYYKKSRHTAQALRNKPNLMFFIRTFLNLVALLLRKFL